MTDSATEPIIRLKDLSFAYGNGPVLEDVTFSVAPLDYVSIVGPNGGGKTTLLKLMLGLLKPTSGIIRIFGRSPEQARPLIGYVPQQFQFDPKFPVRVIDVVLMGRLNKGARIGGYRQADQKTAMNALQEMDLADYARRHFSELSGGQRQRVLIARALASEPQLLMLDEPTANIDVGAQNELYEYLQKINQRMTVVVVTHDASFVAAFVKSVLCVNRRVVKHPTSEFTGEMINNLHGGKVRFVQHDHIHGAAEKGANGHD